MNAVRYERRGRVTIVTIDRPDARNAVNGAVARGLDDALDRFERDDDAWVGVLTGAGSAFCAGVDLKVVAAGGMEELWTEHGFAGVVQYPRTKPLIAAVDGPALAGGCEIALACDLVVASKRATFGLPEVKLGLIAVAGGMFRLPRAMPMQVAMKAMLTGEPISAEAAHAYGLAVDLVEPGTALDAAVELAIQICANAPLAVRASRRVALAALGRPEQELWDLSRSEGKAIRQSADYREGPRAFVEKRRPAWTGG
ncbi:MAG: enoyl-CoA hydratase [Mycobacterium sp.]|nr:enoyl-CoA hydratase [Mycobacterium sp.]